MLISFSFQNWMSFRDETEFSMKAGREKQHQERLAFLPDHDLKLLPVAAVYGGNASGKSNFVAALAFCKGLVCGETHSVPAFRLDKECASQPSRFSVALFADNEKVYEYFFSVTKECVQEEKLVRYGTKPADDATIYHRIKDEINFDAAFSEAEKLRFTFLKEGTRSNQLFLTNAISQNVKNVDIQAVDNWFRHNLVILTPNTKISPFALREMVDNNVCSILSKLDTGIVSFNETELSSDDLKRHMPPMAVEDLRKRLSQTKIFQDSTLFRLENDEIKASLLTTVHESMDGSPVHFLLNEESDGTQRAFDLVPMFVAIASQNSRRVFIIDEIDRSLHTLMIQSLIQAYLTSCNGNNRAQLVFTTHNVMLMDQDIFRRDEIWVTERQSQGQSKLYSFAEFKEVRSDTRICKSYLQGRMGGIPHILLQGPF